MNHLGDTNKMVETPRTDGLLTEILDAYGYVHQGNCPQRWVNHARELERELNAANVELEEKRKDIVWLATEKAKLEDRIKRLKEALDLVRPHCDSVHHSKKHQHQYGEPCPVVALIENAKEAKL